MHSTGVTRICANHEQSILFTCSSDGSLAMSTIQDKDPRRKELIPAIVVMLENVIPKVQRDLLIDQIRRLKSEIEVKKKAENSKLIQVQ